MKRTFIKTQNVKRFITLMEELKKLSPNIPKLAMVYGEHGLGKTHSVIWWATRNDAIYVRANNDINQNGLLKLIVEELGERPFFFMQENYNLILKHLRTEPKIIIVDEVDYLFNYHNAIEILRDIQDNTGVPILLVGMGMVDKKIARLKHFNDRIYKKLKFEHFDENDIKEILESLTDLNFTDDAITYLSTRTNQFRQLVKLINHIEKSSKINEIKDLDEYVLKGLLNERQSIKALPKIEKIFA